MTETGSLALLFVEESVLIPTTPSVSELLTVSCLGVKVPQVDGRLAVYWAAYSHWKLATVWPSRPFCQEMSTPPMRYVAVGPHDVVQSASAGSVDEKATNKREAKDEKRTHDLD